MPNYLPENARIALYIDERGNVVGSEQVVHPWPVDVDQLPEPTAPTPENLADIIAVEVKTTVGSGTQLLKFCYNRQGQRVPCP